MDSPVEYYVNNPNPFEVMVGDTKVAPYATNKKVSITYTEALELKSKGWNPQRRLVDAEQGTNGVGLAGKGAKATTVVHISAVDYAALATKDPNTTYIIPAV